MVHQIDLILLNQRISIEIRKYKFSWQILATGWLACDNYIDSEWSILNDIIAWFCGGFREYSYREGLHGYAFLTEDALDHFIFLTKH